MVGLKSGCKALGLELSSAQLEALARYIELLRKWNKTANLISRKDMSRLVERHILDSLTAVRLIRGQRILDVGSGGGLPGIPLAIVLPNVQMFLCERMSRRARFLTLVVRELALANVSVIGQDVAQLEAAPLFDTIIARAVSSRLRLWAMLRERLVEGGQLIVYSSTQDQGAQAGTTGTVEAIGTAAIGATAIGAAAIKGGRIREHRLEVPGMSNRHTISEITKV